MLRNCVLDEWWPSCMQIHAHTRQCRRGWMLWFGTEFRLMAARSLQLAVEVIVSKVRLQRWVGPPSQQAPSGWSRKALHGTPFIFNNLLVTADRSAPKFEVVLMYMWLLRAKRWDLMTLSVLSYCHSCIQWATRKRPQETWGSNMFFDVVVKVSSFIVLAIRVELPKATLHLLFCKCRFVDVSCSCPSSSHSFHTLLL